VADFLLPVGSWNLQRLQLYFTTDDVEEIMKIKTSRHNEEDFVAWFPEKNGMFTVRSAYRLMLHREMMRHDRGVIRPFCITILYHNLLLFIDIFHI
jgi:hypothetical protein